MAMALSGERSAAKAQVPPHICLYHRLVRRGGVVGGVQDHNTRPMSTTSVASEYFRYFTGIAIISSIMPYQRKVSHKRCWQYNLLGERSRQSLLVECV